MADWQMFIIDKRVKLESVRDKSRLVKQFYSLSNLANTVTRPDQLPGRDHTEFRG